jgi:hypothetical protein
MGGQSGWVSVEYSTPSLWRWNLTEDSETSANHNLTPGKYPKEYIQYSKHGESLKSRMYIGLHVKYSLFLSKSNSCLNFSKDFRKVCRCQISWKIRQVGAEFSLADRRTDMKLIVAFRTFANAPKSTFRYAYSQYCVCPTASACPSPSAIRLTNFVVHTCYQSNFPAVFIAACNFC